MASDRDGGSSFIPNTNHVRGGAVAPPSCARLACSILPMVWICSTCPRLTFEIEDGVSETTSVGYRHCPSRESAACPAIQAEKVDVFVQRKHLGGDLLEIVAGSLRPMDDDEILARHECSVNPNGA